MITVTIICFTLIILAGLLFARYVLTYHSPPTRAQLRDQRLKELSCEHIAALRRSHTASWNRERSAAEEAAHSIAQEIHRLEATEYHDDDRFPTESTRPE